MSSSSRTLTWSTTIPEPMKFVTVLTFALIAWIQAAAVAASALHFAAVKLWRSQPGGFDRIHYGALFFMMTGLAVAGLRATDWLLDATGVVPQDGPSELQHMWEYLLARWSWALSHVGFAGSVGMASFVMSSLGFTVLDVVRSDTKVAPPRLGILS